MTPIDLKTGALGVLIGSFANLVKHATLGAALVLHAAVPYLPASTMPMIQTLLTINDVFPLPILIPIIGCLAYVAISIVDEEKPLLALIRGTLITGMTIAPGILLSDRIGFTATLILTLICYLAMLLTIDLFKPRKEETFETTDVIIRARR